MLSKADKDMSKLTDRQINRHTHTHTLMYIPTYNDTSIDKDRHNTCTPVFIRSNNIKILGPKPAVLIRDIF
jgi:hypothetical protein